MSDYLAHAAAIVGTDRLLFFTDHPISTDRAATHAAFLAERGLDEAGKAAFSHGNWDRVRDVQPT